MLRNVNSGSHPAVLFERGIMRNTWVALTSVAFIGLAGYVAAQTKQSKSDVSRLPRDAAQLYAEAKLFPREPKWQRIPWLVDLNEGIKLAKEEKRPLLLWTSGDDPLERC
jgi:hypothetical protein